MREGTDSVHGGKTQPPLTIIRPPGGWVSLGLSELWEYRELLFFLVWRDVKGRYRQMALGPLWMLLKPLFSLVVFSLVFGRLAKIPSEGLPYPVFAFAALLPWQFFSGAASNAANSLVSNLGVVSKVYFPRLIVPLAAVVSAAAEFVFSLLIFLALILYYGVQPSLNVLALAFYTVLAALTALGVGLWLASLSVRFRDVSFAMGFLLQAWLYLSPVVYPSSLVPDPWRAVYRLNPMATVVEGFRWSILGVGPRPDVIQLLTGFIVLFLALAGAFVFRRTEQTIVDHV